MGPIWGRQDPGGPHVGPMNLAIKVVMGGNLSNRKHVYVYINVIFSETDRFTTALYTIDASQSVPYLSPPLPLNNNLLIYKAPNHNVLWRCTNKIQGT